MVVHLISAIPLLEETAYIISFTGETELHDFAINFYLTAVLHACSFFDHILKAVYWREDNRSNKKVSTKF